MQRNNYINLYSVVLESFDEYEAALVIWKKIGKQKMYNSQSSHKTFKADQSQQKDLAECMELVESPLLQG